MILKTIIELLNTNEWLIGDEDIDIAKGKYKAPVNFSELKKSIKRQKTYNNG